MNLLLLDDEPLELDQLEVIILTHFPEWNVLKAANGSQALKIAEEVSTLGKQLHLAIVDIKLPGKNGLEVAENLKVIYPNMDIIIVSAFQNFDYARHSIHLRVVDYLLKPVIEKELIQILHKFLQDHPEHGIASEFVQFVLQKVKQNYHKPLKLSEIAREMHVNANYLSRLFSEEVGVNFSDYLLRIRIEMAKQLLIRHRHWSIQRVAEESGFNSQHYFSNLFKKMIKQSPKDYRNAHGLE